MTTTMNRALATLLLLLANNSVVNASGVYTIVFKFITARGYTPEDVSPKVACKLYQTTTYAVPNIQGMEEVAVSGGWTAEDYCSDETLEAYRHDVLEPHVDQLITDGEQFTEKEDLTEYQENHDSDYYQTTTTTTRTTHGRHLFEDTAAAAEDTAALITTTTKDQDHRQLPSSDCGTLCSVGALGWCNCSKNRRRLLRGLQQIKMSKEIGAENEERWLYYAATILAHHANHQFSYWTRHHPLPYFVYFGPYDDHTWTGGYNIEVMLVDEATGVSVSSKSTPPDGGSDTTTLADGRDGQRF